MKNWINNYRTYFLFFLAVVTALIWWRIISEWRENNLIVAFFDVGQGDAIFIEAPNGNQVLIDGGRGKAILRELAKVMPFYDRHIDVIIATHPDADHIGGLIDVLERYEVGIFLEPGAASNNGYYRALEETVEEKKIEKIIARRGMRIYLDGKTRMDILHPDGKFAVRDTNDSSIVARLIYNQNEFMLTGDAPKRVEEYLIKISESSEELQSDVLKAGHHGSRTSTSELFVKAIKPQYAVISSGKNNSYGHPHKEALDILSKYGAKILRTDKEEMILFQSDGQIIKVK